MSAVAASIPSLETASKTDAGLLRALNEDSIAVIDEIGLLVLADGMGGHSRGDVASNIAATTIVDVVRRGLREDPGAPAGALVKRAVKIANGAICLESVRRAQNPRLESGQSMGSTVAVLLFRDDRATFAHVGDSRVYRLREHRIELLTHDHSLLQEQIDLGILSTENAGASHNRHLVTRGLGFQPRVSVSLGQSAVLPGDLYMICSDGLNDMVDGTDIELVLNALQANLPLAASQLVMIANDHGGEDNISVILAKVGPKSIRNYSLRGFLAHLFRF
ncbi:MAG: protein phosphatase 2C domain-containing protein [Betaproteobacteria bacterium]